MNDRCGIKRWLEWVPAWMLTGVVALAIAWLTLAPVPPEAVHLELFKGADKWVHAIMFGALTSCIMLDRQRHACWHELTPAFAFMSGGVSTLAGVAIEYLQRYMEPGRSYDPGDIAADAGGALVALLFYLALQPLWSDEKRAGRP